MLPPSWGIPLWKIISDAESVQTLAGRSARSVLQFVDLVNTLQRQAEHMPPAEVVQRVIEDSGLMAHLKAEGTDEAEERLRNLGELVNAALQYQAETDAPQLRDFLTSAALASEDTDKDRRDLKTDRVVLMTFHASKGLEFPFVALMGLEQGLFPNHRAMDDPAAMEEERRLCYVGLTRAMDELHLFHARARRLWGGGREAAPPLLFPGGTAGAGGGDSTSPAAAVCSCAVRFTGTSCCAVIGPRAGQLPMTP